MRVRMRIRNPSPWPDPYSQSEVERRASTDNGENKHFTALSSQLTVVCTRLSARLTVLWSHCLSLAFTSVSGFRLLVVLRPTRKLLLKWTAENENETEPRKPKEGKLSTTAVHGLEMLI